jgi:hypothetical protein
MVGQGRDPADVTKKYMWEEKVELQWRIQGHEERKELCKRVSWDKRNPGKAVKMKMVCSSNTLAIFYQTTWCHILEDHIIHCYSWYIEYVLRDAPVFYPWYRI